MEAKFHKAAQHGIKAEYRPIYKVLKVRVWWVAASRLASALNNCALN